MTDLAVLDRAYHSILTQIIETAQAPHYTEVAKTLGVFPEEAKAVVREVIESTPGWFHPGTDYLASFPPFNVQPTQYRVSIDGRPGWFAQCGFEATAIRWLFPGRAVRIEAPCLCCGDQMVIEMRDDEILLVDPDTIVGYTSAEVGGDAANRPFR
jgi:hypothetical protein